MPRIGMTALIFPILFLGACAMAPPSIDTGPDAEVTYDGLHRVLNTRADRAWARPDIDLSGYDKVFLTGAGIEWRPVKGKPRRYATASQLSRTTEFPVSEEDKEKLRQIVTLAFLEELAKSDTFTLVDARGPGVLEVRGALLDVVSHVPPEPIGRGEIYIRDVGEATLVVQLYDSESEAILARVVDRRAAETAGWDLQAMSMVNTTVEVRRLARSWARLLRQRLEEAMAD